MNCEFCDNTFANKIILKTHQNTAKYCLKIQGKIVSKVFPCKMCMREFNTKLHLQNHSKTHTDSDEEMYKRNQYLENELENFKNQLLYSQDIILKQENQIKEFTRVLERIAMNKQDFEEEAVIEIEMEIEENEEEKCVEEYQLTPLDVGKGLTIEHREKDGYINVTNLCKAGGKQFKHWNSLERTKAFLQVLSTAVGIPTTELIKLGTGSKFGSENQGVTWVHPQVAINIAQWISPQFDVKVSAWVYEVMMTGKVDITATKSYQQLREENKTKDLKIQYLTKKYVKAQPRVQYKERNVVYILTTRLLKTERRYILGKATNLTYRLSTYNKDDEHEVVYYQECQNKKKMSLVETLVLSNLDEYREQANRDRFVLPENQKIDLFIETIKECVEFVK